MDIQLDRASYFISGIDTDAGKSYATALLATVAHSQGKSVITQKFIQTGCDPSEISEDIITHRRLQGVELMAEDYSRLTTPQIFRLPSSPHLAAQLDGREVDVDRITSARLELERRFDVVLVEGAGGIMVPIRRGYLTADYIVEHSMPTIIVSSARLGSLNHTLLTLEYCLARGIEVAGVVYNLYPQSDPHIERDTRAMVCDYLSVKFPQAWIVDLPRWDE
ncbi:MAG: dethiobiotin synthase [Rikenellaceae bacterium]